jgi:hypothetical protein
MWRELVAMWRDFEPRQRSAGKVVLVWFVVSTALDSMAPSEPPPWPWWVTVLLDVLVLSWLYVGRRRPSYTRWRESLRPQDLPRFDQLMAVMLPLLIASIVTWLALGDSIVTRVVAVPPVAVLCGVIVLSAGARKSERRRRQWSLPWPFNVSPRVRPPDAKQ